MIKEIEKSINIFLEDQLNFYPNANRNVLKFIANFLYHGVPDVSLEQSCESVRSTFRAGYCFYFATMLKTAFNRGEICWAAPFGHIVWVDDDGIPYDVEGVNDSECDYYIPISFLGDAIFDFMHVEGKEYSATDDDLDRIIKEYLEFKNKKES